MYAISIKKRPTGCIMSTIGGTVPANKIQTRGILLERLKVRVAPFEQASKELLNALER